MQLTEAIRTRRSVRGFDRSRAVPPDTLQSIFSTAQHAPSNCNVQPWRAVIASGTALERLRSAVLHAYDSGEQGPIEVPFQAFHDDYRRLQVECAVEMYSKMGVARGDKRGRARAERRNFEFFDAPHVALICMDRAFGMGVALDVGMYVQTLMLLMTANGIGSCAQASIRRYPDVCRRELPIGDELMILCAIAFGYEDPDVPANASRQTREPPETNVTFCRE